MNEYINSHMFFPDDSADKIMRVIKRNVDEARSRFIIEPKIFITIGVGLMDSLEGFSSNFIRLDFTGKGYEMLGYPLLVDSTINPFEARVKYINECSMPRMSSFYSEALRNIGRTKSVPFASITPKKVIFNDPATIVYWKDGTKTVVKCQPGDTFDKEKGLAMALAKKVLGNKGNYNEYFKRWL